MTQLPAADTLPQFSEIFETFTPTIKFIPPAVCTEWSRVLGGVLDRLAADPGNISLWKHLYMLPVCIFPASGLRDKRVVRVYRRFGDTPGTLLGGR